MVIEEPAIGSERADKMKTSSLVITVLAILSCARGIYGMGEERVGPDSPRGRQTFAQPDWPVGIIEVPRHGSRVYSVWVNGDERFYFKAHPSGINELIGLFSKARMRDHQVCIKSGKQQVKTFGGDKISYNACLHVPAGIALDMSQPPGSADTHEPTLTLYVDPDADHALLKQMTLPANIILSSEVANCPLTGKATQPRREVWHALVQFDDLTPAADLEHHVVTRITLWEAGINEGILLGKVSRDGRFDAAFSEKEIADLKAGQSWLTLTVGNSLTKPKSDHLRLSVENLSLLKSTVQPVKIGRPRFYYGRILFEDGSPPILNPLPWSGAKIRVNFPYTGPVPIDSEGYFKVYFSDEQYEKIKDEKAQKNILIPSYGTTGMSTARFEFPVSGLSQKKEKAGVVRILRPEPNKDDSK